VFRAGPSGLGWITCEYVMLPASTPQRKPLAEDRSHRLTRHGDPAIDRPGIAGGGSTLKRSARTTIAIDCQVLQAERRPPRTAATPCGGYVRRWSTRCGKLPAEMPPAAQTRPISRRRFRRDWRLTTPAFLQARAEGNRGAALGWRLSVGCRSMGQGAALTWTITTTFARRGSTLNCLPTRPRENLSKFRGGRRRTCGGVRTAVRMNRLLDLAVAGCEAVDVPCSRETPWSKAIESRLTGATALVPLSPPDSWRRRAASRVRVRVVSNSRTGS